MLITSVIIRGRNPLVPESQKLISAQVADQQDIVKADVRTVFTQFTLGYFDVKTYTIILFSVRPLLAAHHQQLSSSQLSALVVTEDHLQWNPANLLLV